MNINVNDQIHLAEFQWTDQAACLDHMNAREIYDQNLRIPYPYNAADFAVWMEIVEKATAQQGRPIHWAIRDKQENLLGCLGFDSLEVGKSHRAEISYWLAKPFWGRGIMTAVVRQACQYAFAEYGLVKIMAHVFADNSGSVKVLEKCGFQQEGYLRKHFLKEGKLIDARLFGLLKE